MTGRSTVDHLGEAANGHSPSSAARESQIAMAGSKAASRRSTAGLEVINPLAMPQLNQGSRGSPDRFVKRDSVSQPKDRFFKGQGNFDHLLSQVQQAHKEEIEFLQEEIASLQKKVSKLGRGGRPRGRMSQALDWDVGLSSISSVSSWNRGFGNRRQESPESHTVDIDDTAIQGPIGEEPLAGMPKNSAVTSAVGNIRHWPEDAKAEKDVTAWVRNALKTELEAEQAREALQEKKRNISPASQDSATRSGGTRRLNVEENNNEYVNLDGDADGASESLKLGNSSHLGGSSQVMRHTMKRHSNASYASLRRNQSASKSFEEGPQLEAKVQLWRDMVLGVLALASKELFIIKPCWVQSQTFLRKAHRGAHHYLDLFAVRESDMNHRFSSASVKSNLSGHGFLNWNPLRDANHLIVDPQSPRRMIWALVGMLLMIYDLVMLPMQAFEMPDNLVLSILSWMFQIFWTLDMGVSAVTSYYVNGELETRIVRIVRTYLTTWFPIDCIITVPLWVILVLGWDSARTGNSVRSARYFRMLRFLRLMRLVKFESLWGEALGFVNSASAILVIGMAKLMFLMILLNHLAACVWYAIGRSGEGQGENAGWAYDPKIQDGDITYKYLSSMHWTLTQFQGTSDITPGGTLAERIYAVVFLLMALFILTIFISSLTNRMMQFQNLQSQRTYEERVVRGYLSNHDITHQLSVRIKKYLEWKQRLKRSQEYDEEVFNILPLQLMMDLLDEVRGPTCADNHPFFSAFREAYPRVMRRLCFEAITPTSPMPGEQVFSPGDSCTGMYFIVNGHVNYTVSTDKRLCRQKTGDQEKLDGRRVKSQRWTTMNQIKSRSPSPNAGVQSNTPAIAASGSMTTRHTTEQLADLGLMNVTSLTMGHFLSEAVLWTFWHHVGSLNVVSDSMLLVLNPQRFEEVVSIYAQAQASSVLYARRFVASLNSYGKHYNDYIEAEQLQEMIDTHNEDPDCSDSDEEDDWSDDSDFQDYEEDDGLQHRPSTL